MLTYNSDAFTLSTWDSFLAHMRRLHRSLGARAFSACLEKSMHARSTSAQAGAPQGQPTLRG